VLERLVELQPQLQSGWVGTRRARGFSLQSARVPQRIEDMLDVDELGRFREGVGRRFRSAGLHQYAARDESLEQLAQQLFGRIELHAQLALRWLGRAADKCPHYLKHGREADDLFERLVR
jgi:hypothetical protein